MRSRYAWASSPACALSLNQRLARWRTIGRGPSRTSEGAKNSVNSSRIGSGVASSKTSWNAVASSKSCCADGKRMQRRCAPSRSARRESKEGRLAAAWHLGTDTHARDRGRSRPEKRLRGGRDCGAGGQPRGSGGPRAKRRHPCRERHPRGRDDGGCGGGRLRPARFGHATAHCSKRRDARPDGRRRPRRIDGASKKARPLRRSLTERRQRRAQATPSVVAVR
jgi:hypothetical protein